MHWECDEDTFRKIQWNNFNPAVSSTRLGNIGIAGAYGKHQISHAFKFAKDIMHSGVSHFTWGKDPSLSSPISLQTETHRLGYPYICINSYVWQLARCKHALGSKEECIHNRCKETRFQYSLRKRKKPQQNKIKMEYHQSLKRQIASLLRCWTSNTRNIIGRLFQMIPVAYSRTFHSFLGTV